MSTVSHFLPLIFFFLLLEKSFNFLLLPFSDWSEKDKKHLEQELSDVLIYLIRLSEKCHVDLPKAALEKIAINSKKYPAEKVRSCSKKYNEYDWQSWLIQDWYLSTKAAESFLDWCGLTHMPFVGFWSIFSLFSYQTRSGLHPFRGVIVNRVVATVRSSRWTFMRVVICTEHLPSI